MRPGKDHAVHRPQRGDADQEAHRPRAPRAQAAAGHVGGHRVRLAHAGKSQGVQKGQVYQQVDRHDGQGAQQQAAEDILAGFAYLGGHIAHFDFQPP